ncbi:MAG TPA: cytochrome P450 [Pseudonocardiaceae bacterium]|jgi:cytochrome P450|nr:cytochrome P450 [Pseudonocardiaceae bacterium]
MAIAPALPTTVDATLPPGPRWPILIQTILFGQYRPRLLPLLQRRHGDIFTIRMAPRSRRLVVLARPEDIKTVFTGPASVFHAGEGNVILGPIMGKHSVLLVDEAAHVRVRRLLMPAFHGAALRGYQQVVAELAEAEARRWPSGRAFASHDRMHALTLEVILRVVFGVTDEARLDALRPLVRRVVDIGPLIMLGWFYPNLQRVGPWRRYMAIQQELDRLLYAEIAQRRTATDLAERDDVLSRLLRTGAGADGDGQDSDRADADGLTDGELRDQLVTLLLAGHETTATTLAWAFHDLARNPVRLRAAQRAADEGNDEYLTAVVKESLRLHPVIYEVARRLTAPVEIAGYRLPAGAIVLPGIGLVQADERHHLHPREFRPERFLDGQPAANTWIPFGGGVRRCLGAGFAQMEAAVVLREVLTRFDLRPVHARQESSKARNITQIPAGGARIVVTPRG